MGGGGGGGKFRTLAKQGEVQRSLFVHCIPWPPTEDMVRFLRSNAMRGSLLNTSSHLVRLTHVSAVRNFHFRRFLSATTLLFLVQEREGFHSSPLHRITASYFLLLA